MTPETLATIGLAMTVTGLVGMAVREVRYGPLFRALKIAERDVKALKRAHRRWELKQQIIDAIKEQVPAWAK